MRMPPLFHQSPIWPLLFALCLSSTPAVLAKKRRPPPTLEEEPQFRLNDVAEQNAAKFVEGKCAFYCFFVPLLDDEAIDLHFYKNMSCSDIVYGFAQVGDRHFQFPTKRDLLPHSYYGNFKLITSLQLISTKPRVLLGIKMAPNIKFLQADNAELALNVSRRMVFHARRYGFSGIFLKFESDVLLTPGFEQFVELLSGELKVDGDESKGRRLTLVLSISSNWVRYVYRRMPKFDAHFDAFYLWADETDSTGEMAFPSKAVPVDPLFRSEQVPRADALAENAERLAATGVSRHKIIIGLSAWARSYFLQNASDPRLPAEVEAYGNPGEETMQADGKLAYQEVCGNDDGMLDYDNQSETISFRHDDLWVSYNPPKHPAFIQKLDWISNNEFGGVGLYSLQADDPNNNCSQGVLPLHQSVSQQFKCRRGTKRGNSDIDQCTRLCLLNMDRLTNTFAFEQLHLGWCSHIVLGHAVVNPFLPSMPKPGMRRALAMYNDWDRERKPYLILSFTGTADQWRGATVSPAKYVLIENIRRLLNEHNADGVDLNCANGGPDGLNHAFQFNAFLSDLRRTLGHQKQIMVSLHPNSFIEDKNYDFASMSRSVNYFVAIGYRFHRHTNADTGHHSPLFPASMLNQPKMTIQGMVDTMLAGGTPREKLIVALSAEAMSQHFADDLHNHRPWESRKIGEPAARIYPKTRAHGPGVVSQTTVCEIMKRDSTLSYFLNDLGVPYLINNEREFIAFDNKRSIQIKTVWISLQGLGGIALHGLEMDNVGGECPQGQSFPLLRTIVESQVCIRCNASAGGSTVPSTTADMSTTLELPSSMEQFAVDSSNAAANGPEAIETEKEMAPEEEPEGDPMERISSTTTTMPPHLANCQQKEGEPRFSVFCTLPFGSIGKKLSLDKLPLERCDSLLLTDWAKLNADGAIMFEELAADGEESLKKLTEIARGNGTALWAEVPCAMNPEQWEMVMGLTEKREQVALAMANLVANKNLTGLLLDCDAQMQPSVRTIFSQLLNEMNAEFMENSASAADCPPQMALKLQLSRTNISEVYEPEQLNKLLKFILLPSGVAVSKTKAKILNPLYGMGIANQETAHTQNGTLSSWLTHQLKPGLVLMELPTFGIRQKRDAEKAEPEIVGQNEVCEFMRKTGTHQYTRYDAVAAYWYTKNEWLSAENRETVKYKVEFMMQHRLGGAMVRSLDADDPEDGCKNEAGGYQILETVHNARCDRKPYDVGNKPRLERDMLGTMVIGRGRR